MKRWKVWRRSLVLLAVVAAAGAVAVGSSSAMNAGAVSAGGHAAKTPLVCACGGGGLPYCDAGHVGVVLWATWYSFIQPGYYTWQTTNFRCSYNSAAAIERTWAIQAGLDPDSGPGRFWLIA
jgi:hypothetical protein